MELIILFNGELEAMSVTLVSSWKWMEKCMLLKVKMVGIGLDMVFKKILGNNGKNGQMTPPLTLPLFL